MPVTNSDVLFRRTGRVLYAMRVCYGPCTRGRPAVVLLSTFASGKKMAAVFETVSCTSVDGCRARDRWRPPDTSRSRTTRRAERCCQRRELDRHGEGVCGEGTGSPQDHCNCS
ncbi:unnamed protein product [Macrosiphum euphorbiae]|uniref:Uncharacterized protein n=1 Tax=Macrosiphum euphorbiae TaxID=13131 RepID=A0AAV0WAF4_9HEMI|nr:unnamed protein product [Macrosiphum euphorbiae]